MRTLATPDVTLAQIKATIVMVVGQLVAFGLIGNGTAEVVVSITSTVLASVLVIGDAIIRNGRSKVAAAKQGIELADSVEND